MGNSKNQFDSKKSQLETIIKDLLKDVPNLYESENVKNPLCYIKLFTPDSSFTWYVMEYSKDDLDTCFGYVVGLESELGYFSLSEIMGVRGALGLSVEVDMAFKPTGLNVIKKNHR